MSNCVKCQQQLKKLQQQALPSMTGRTTTYYMDMTQPPIGNRPVVSRRTDHLAQPAIMVPGSGSAPFLADRRFDCKQWNWCKACM